MEVLQNNNISDGDYRKFHESFMQNHKGSSPLHTFLCVLFSVLCSIICSIRNKHDKKLSIFKEYLYLVCPIVFAHTILSHYIFHLNIIAIVILMYKFYKIPANVGFFYVFNQKNQFRSRKLASVTSMRSLTYLVTVLCILAVDFQVFPRYLAKTETYGYSFMDTGVGLFVVMSGLVHKDYRNKNFIYFLLSNLKLVAVLTSLGFSRYISVKQLDYQEHVTEYGVHLNFFFVLAIAKLCSSIILYFAEPLYSLIVSILLIAVHEYFLHIGLEQWVFSDVPRNTFLSANREGLTCCLGYIALYMMGVHFNRVISSRKAPRLVIVLHIFLSAIIFWILLCLVKDYKPISRILANMTYFVYILAIMLSIWSILYFFEAIFESYDAINFVVPKILFVINENGLLYFLAANLLTGAVNLNIKTLFVNHVFALIILNAYMVCCIVIALTLHRYGIKV